MLFSVFITISAAVLLGYIIAYLINFFHEAAHFNIAPGKKMNDTLANLFIGILIAQGIKNYRIVHWQHHVALGTTSDTENSYFESLNLHFFITSLTGISALKFFFTRNEYVTNQHKIPANILKLEKYSILAVSLAIPFIFTGNTLLFTSLLDDGNLVHSCSRLLPFLQQDTATDGTPVGKCQSANRLPHCCSWQDQQVIWELTN